VNGFLIASLLLLLVAAGLSWGAWSSAQRHKHLSSTETTDLGTLRELHRAATEAAGPGAFRQVVDIEGTAQPGPGGPLEAPLTGAECVWHKHSVVRKDQVVELEDGKRITRNREETESDHTTETPFVVRDATGEVEVVPSRAVDRAEQSVDDFVRAGLERHGFGNRGKTLGRKRCEWLLRPGTRIFVHGEAVDRGGALVIVEPEGKDKLLVSTRSEAEVLAGAASGHKWMRIAAIASAAVAVALGVVGVMA
jgi:E3 Ubiquitin ligase